MEYFNNDLIKKLTVIIISILILLLVLYFWLLHDRTDRCLKNSNNKYTKVLHMQSLTRNKKIMSSNYKLSDFYIASSYKSYLACSNYYDLISVDAIKNCLLNGCRFIDLDIYNNDFTKDSEPVVAYGKEIGNWKYTNSLCFEKCCKCISDFAFSQLVLNSNDPLFINLNLYINQNLHTVDKIASYIYKYFSLRLLPPKYSYQGVNANIAGSVNISETPIKELFNKIIFICDQHELIKDSKLDEIINISSDIGNYKSISIENLLESNKCNCSDPMSNSVTKKVTDLKDYNKKYLTKFYAPIHSRNQTNLDYKIGWYTGCQFICMNYNNPDENMLKYLNEFKDYALVLKPYKLRVKNRYNTSKLMNTPHYNINY